LTIKQDSLHPVVGCLIGGQMKSWPQKLREIPIERLAAMIKEHRIDITVKQRDLDAMERIMSERASNAEIECEKKKLIEDRLDGRYVFAKKDYKNESRTT